jgi:hypothetical protein
MKNDLEKYLDSQYEDLFEKIKDCELFGESLDLNNPKKISLAFYHYAKSEDIINFQKERDIYQSVLKIRNIE